MRSGLGGWNGLASDYHKQCYHTRQLHVKCLLERHSNRLWKSSRFQRCEFMLLWRHSGHTLLGSYYATIRSNNDSVSDSGGGCAHVWNFKAPCDDAAEVSGGKPCEKRLPRKKR